MEDDKAFQGVICIYSLDFIYMFHVHGLLILICARHDNVELMLPMDIGGMALGTNCCLGKKLLQKGEATWDDLPMFTHGSGEMSSARGNYL